MVLIVCVDDRNGMSFNGRRQSSDRVLCERILSVVGDKHICMRPSSARIFPVNSENICVCEDLLPCAEESDYCFLEMNNPAQLLDRADGVILYRWNRTYPADLYFPVDTLRDGWQLISTFDFPGNSHQQITEEVYRK